MTQPPAKDRDRQPNRSNSLKSDISLCGSGAAELGARAHVASFRRPGSAWMLPPPPISGPISRRELERRPTRPPAASGRRRLTRPAGAQLSLQLAAIGAKTKAPRRRWTSDGAIGAPVLAAASSARPAGSRPARLGRRVGRAAGSSEWKSRSVTPVGGRREDYNGDRPQAPGDDDEGSKKGRAV